MEYRAGVGINHAADVVQVITGIEAELVGVDAPAHVVDVLGGDLRDGAA